MRLARPNLCRVTPVLQWSDISKPRGALMTFDQILLFALFGVILSMLLWGRLRYDLVAAGGLLVAVVLLPPKDRTDHPG